MKLYQTLPPLSPICLVARKYRKPILPVIVTRFCTVTLLALSCIIMLQGCTSTTVEIKGIKVHRVSFCQSVNVRITPVPGSDIPLIIYSNDGGANVASSAATVASSAMVGASIQK